MLLCARVLMCMVYGASSVWCNVLYYTHTLIVHTHLTGIGLSSKNRAQMTLFKTIYFLPKMALISLFRESSFHLHSHRSHATKNTALLSFEKMPKQWHPQFESKLLGHLFRGTSICFIAEEQHFKDTKDILKMFSYIVFDVHIQRNREICKWVNLNYFAMMIN